MSGSANSGSASCPNALTRVKNSTPKLIIVNQCATATTGRRDMRVWPRNSRSSVTVRAPLSSVRSSGGAEAEHGQEVADHAGEQGDGHERDHAADDERDDLEGRHGGHVYPRVSVRLPVCDPSLNRVALGAGRGAVIGAHVRARPDGDIRTPVAPDISVCWNIHNVFFAARETATTPLPVRARGEPAAYRK